MVWIKWQNKSSCWLVQDSNSIWIPGYLVWLLKGPTNHLTNKFWSDIQMIVRNHLNIGLEFRCILQSNIRLVKCNDSVTSQSLRKISSLHCCFSYFLCHFCSTGVYSDYNKKTPLFWFLFPLMSSIFFVLFKRERVCKVLAVPFSLHRAG